MFIRDSKVKSDEYITQQEFNEYRIQFRINKLQMARLIIEASRGNFRTHNHPINFTYNGRTLSHDNNIENDFEEDVIDKQQ